jgi:MoaA/NifB/PqqE/SkfB family radical SAM enzyme
MVSSSSTTWQHLPERFPVRRAATSINRPRQVHRGDEMFKRLRPDGLVGKCGRCQFRDVCGGSRARAFAATGAVMGSDPLCAYEPGPNVEAPVGRA